VLQFEFVNLGEHRLPFIYQIAVGATEKNFHE
jgi:hypothetical protein